MAATSVPAAAKAISNCVRVDILADNKRIAVTGCYLEIDFGRNYLVLRPRRSRERGEKQK
jgi:hypothetical protein